MEIEDVNPKVLDISVRKTKRCQLSHRLLANWWKSRSNNWELELELP